MKITISGLPGSGTTTTGRLLSEKLGIPFYSAGEIFRKMAREKNMTIEQFSEYARKNEEVDRLIDSTQREIAGKIREGVIEGRLSGWMVRDATLRVWLYADEKTRYERISMREGRKFEEVARVTRIREKSERERYRKFYGIDIDDMSIYHLILNSERFSPHEMVRIIACSIDKNE